MSDEDQDFWETYIPATPEADQDFAGCAPLLLVIGGFVVLVIVLALIAAL